MRILAVETSCDETAVAIVEFDNGRRPTRKTLYTPKIRVLANLISSQVKLHAKFGGVVPNLAKREHQRNLVPILLKALQEARSTKQELRKRVDRNVPDSILDREPELLKRFKKQVVNIVPPEIDAIAVTYGPGLAPALWVGVNFARALSYLWGKPLIPTNHMEGHLYSALLQKNSKHEVRNPKREKENFEFRISNFEFPAIALLVSGGHTELVLVKNYGKYKIIGETVDDAAGEAFDKVARILGLPYPGGPEISRLAEKLPATSYQLQAKLPRPMLNSKDYNFSFSGLKTAVLYLWRDLKNKKQLKPLVAKEFQDAVVDVLVKKTILAAKKYKAKTIILGGGVAANKLLRHQLAGEVKKNLPATSYWLPAPFMTGDNALMIALAAWLGGKKRSLLKVRAEANLRLGERTPR